MVFFKLHENAIAVRQIDQSENKYYIVFFETSYKSTIVLLRKQGSLPFLPRMFQVLDKRTYKVMELLQRAFVPHITL